jgi:hypothetical protein
VFDDVMYALEQLTIFPDNVDSSPTWGIWGGAGLTVDLDASSGSMAPEP